MSIRATQEGGPVVGRAKILGVVGLGIVLLGGYLVFSKARIQNSPRGRIDGIVFDSSMHGYIQVLESQKTIYETNDGGKTWKRFQGGTTGFRRGRSFANRVRGWSIFENMWDQGKIFRTDDAGASWRTVFDAKNQNDFVFGGIQAVSNVDVWATGLSGTFYSADGGLTWERRGYPGTGLQFLDAKHGWVEDDKLWHTDDGGRTWNSVEAGGKSCFGGLGFFFLDENRGWAVGYEPHESAESRVRTGIVTASMDGGKTCIEIARIPRQVLWSVFFLNNREGLVGGIGSVLTTQDGGQTWSLVYGRDYETSD